MVVGSVSLELGARKVLANSTVFEGIELDSRRLGSTPILTA